MPNRPTNCSNNSKNGISQNYDKNIHIVVSHTKGLSKNCKKICSKHGILMHFKGSKTIRDLLVNPKNKNTIHQESGWYMDLSMQGWTARMYALMNLDEHLKKDSKSIQRHPHLSMTITTPQVIPQLWKTSALWGGGSNSHKTNKRRFM